MLLRNSVLIISILVSSAFAGCNTNEPDNEDAQFICDGGNCVEDPNGSYSSLTDCENSCSGTLYSCSNGNCVVDTNGQFSSLSDCESSCTNNITVTPGAGVTDIDGNFYETVVYGNGQEWMASNLKVTTRPDGTPIPDVTDANDWSVEFGGAWAYYQNNPQNIDQGILYNRPAAHGACPTGWSLPSNNEWSELIEYLDPNAQDVTGASGTQSTVVGGMMKEAGVLHWASPNTGATNESGFTALPTGRRFSTGQFSSTNDLEAAWWSSTYMTNLNQPDHSYGRFVNHDDGRVRYGNMVKVEGHTVRCIKD